MECCRRKLPVELEFPKNVELDEQKQERFTCLQKKYQKLPTLYQSRKGLRIVVLALLIAGIAAAVLAQNGVFHLTPTQFVQGLNQMLHQLNWVKVGVGVGVSCVLLTGAILVIKRVINKTDLRTGVRIGSLSGDSHWVPIVKENRSAKTYFPGYIDTSTVKEGQKSRAYVYNVKGVLEHYFIAVAVAVTTPLHAALVIVYNAVRLVVLPIILIVAMIIEKVRGRPFREGNPILLKHIFIQMGFSIKEIFKAPFYALAMTFAALYALIDPLNGRKLGAYIEKDWNNDVDVVQGFAMLWMISCQCMSRVQFEGAKFLKNNKDKKTTMVDGFSPELFRPPALYFPMCWQWAFMADYNKEGKITTFKDWDDEIDNQKCKYTFYTLDSLKRDAEEIIK